MSNTSEALTLLDDHRHPGDDCLVHEVIQVLKELVAEESIEIVKVEYLVV